MFKSILTGLASGGQGIQGTTATTTNGGSKGVTPAQLRQDIYTGIDGICAWIASGKAENGIDYRSILTLVDKHFPGTTINRCTDEVPVLVGGLTNMIFEYSKADAIPGSMALRTFTERLITALASLNDDAQTRKTTGMKVVQGFTQVADPALATREFAPRVQIVGALKTLTAAVYGQGSTEASTGL